MRITALLLVAALAGCTTAPLPSPHPSDAQPSSAAVDAGTLFVGGLVVTGAPLAPHSGLAIHVSGGLIDEVGPDDTLRAKHAGARIVDVAGTTVLPGLVDAHGHLYGLGLALDIVDLVGTTSQDEVVRRVVERAAATPGDGWIQGRGWDQNDWPVKEFPTASLLDAVLPERPVVLRRIDGHAAWANTAAMKAARVNAKTADPAGGRIIRDASGNPTGVFVDAAMDLLERVTPPATPEQVKARVLAAANAIAATGLTGMHDAGIDNDTIRAAKELIDEGRFPIRVYGMLTDDASLLDEWFQRGSLIDYGGRLTVRSVKLYADGALGSRGAALLDHYSDDPANSGLMIADPAHVEEVSRRARAAGFQVNTHAIGDRGVRNVIDGYNAAGVGAAERFRVEHLQVIAPEDVPRLAELGIIASMQPTHATSDMYWAEARLGPQRVRGAYAWRTVLNAGARLALGSDFPVENVNPFFGIHAAVTRQDQKNWPEGGWYPDQRLTLPEAIRGFTSDAAFAAFQENSRGTIEPGRLADFTIVEGNLFEMPERDLWKASVRYTVVNGEIVYDAKTK